VHLAIGDVDERRNIAAQVQQRMQLDRRLVPPESGPRKQRQAQIDGRRIQRIQALVQLDAYGLAGIQPGAPKDGAVRPRSSWAPVSGFAAI